MPIRVFITDDHGIVRDGLRTMLQSQPDLMVVGEANNGLDCLRRLPDARPDVLLLDIAMPGLNGIEVALQLHQDNLAVKVIILSMHMTSAHVRRALQARASGYLVKECAGSEVAQAVRTVFSGRRFFSRKIADLVVQEGLLASPTHFTDPLESLSARERQVLQLVVEGRTSASIATLLALSPKTVETYRSRFMEKLRIDDLPTLVKFAIKHGLTSAE
jgi:DNA-binding NarL/FixJ family response regulator